MANDLIPNLQNALSPSEEQYQVLIDNLADGVALAQDGKHVFVNQSFADIFGYSREELIGTKPESLIAPEELEIMKERLEKRRRGETIPSHYETVGLRKDGQKVYLEVFGSMVTYAGKLTNQVTVRDITARKLAEEKIYQLNQQLERRILELLMANQGLEEYDYTISHELRNPVQVIKGAGYILSEYYSSLLDNQGKESIRLIEKNIKTMEQLIENILTYAKLGRQAIHSQPIELSDMVQAIYDELNCQFPEPKRQMVIDPMPTAYGDLVMLHKVLFNLIGNAFKFTQKTTQPTITIGGREEAKQKVYYVKDNGVGLIQQDTEKIFDIFHRGHDSTEYAGSGVGLAIVQRAILRHHGRVWAESNSDSGATFYFSLPKSEKA